MPPVWARAAPSKLRFAFLCDWLDRNPPPRRLNLLFGDLAERTRASKCPAPRLYRFLNPPAMPGSHALRA
jgi:hypothetical protein